MRSAYSIKIPQTLEEICDPNQVTLLGYDMRVGILSQIRDAERITHQVLKVLRAARDAVVRVFYSRWLDFALRDCGMKSFIIVGVATEIGIEPTARHGADLGYIPVLSGTPVGWQ
jgi:nicotinamidase-related amidase